MFVLVKGKNTKGPRVQKKKAREESEEMVTSSQESSPVVTNPPETKRRTRLEITFIQNIFMKISTPFYSTIVQLKARRLYFNKIVFPLLGIGKSANFLTLTLAYDFHHCGH